MTQPALSTIKLPHLNRAGGVCQPKDQQGVALLTVLLLVVAITVVAGSMLASQKISIRQYELLQTQNQIINDIRAAEQIAAALIKADAQVNETDSLQDVWAQPIAPIQLEAHQVTLTIQDASSKFNINNLYDEGQVDEQSLAVFKRLLAQQNLDVALANAVIEWQGIDSESVAQKDETSNTTAETHDKANGAVINPPFLSVEQLTSVNGFTPDVVRQLKPYITVMPYYQPINLNTAEPEVLGALAEGITTEQVGGFVNARKTNPGQDVQSLLNEPPWSGLSAEEKEALLPLVDIRSHGFQVLIDIAVSELGSTQNKDKATKHRYATTFISKLDPSSIQNKQLAAVGLENISPQGTNTQNSNSMSSGDGSANRFEIVAFGTRLWTYRPSL